MRIAFTGPQGSGKSTILQQCKESDLFKGYEFIPSATRMLRDKYNLKINQESNDITQRHIADWYKDQHENHHHENAIYDRCVLDGLVYTDYLYRHGKVSKEAFEYIKDVFEQYKDDYDVIFYTMPLPLVDDGTRSMDEEYLKDIHETFQKYITDVNGLKCLHVLDGSKEERFNKIKNVIQHHQQLCNSVKTNIVTLEFLYKSLHEHYTSFKQLALEIYDDFETYSTQFCYNYNFNDMSNADKLKMYAQFDAFKQLVDAQQYLQACNIGIDMLNTMALILSRDYNETFLIPNKYEHSDI